MKQIVKKFNNSVKRTILKLQNKTNNNFIISNFNKYLITIIATLFIYLFYLLTPLLYDKTWVQNNIESKLLNEFNINLSSSADISYLILPAPHFLVKDSKILMTKGKNKKSIADIKNFQIFLSQANLFNKKKMNIKRLVINDANFYFLRNDIQTIKEFKKKKLSNKKIIINKSNIFFKDNLDEVISIIKINNSVAYFNDKKLINFLNLTGEVFNIPFNFNLQYQNDSTIFEKTHISIKPLKLNISNELTTKKNLTSGENSISFLNSTVHTKYNVKDKLIIFRSDSSRYGDSRINYNGELLINPFDLSLDIRLDNHKISKLFNFNPILIEFIKSGLLFNNNINIKNSITINSNKKKEFFQNAKINFSIINGKFNLDDTTFTSNKLGLLELSSSNLFLENNNLILNTDILFKVKDSDRLFSFLNTNKKSRKEIKNILINLNYNFLKDEIKFNKVKINNDDISDQFLNIIESSNNSPINLIKSRLLLNKLFSIYAG